MEFKEFYTAEEALKMVGCSYATFLRMHERGDLVPANKGRNGEYLYTGPEIVRLTGIYEDNCKKYRFGKFDSGPRMKKQAAKIQISPKSSITS